MLHKVCDSCNADMNLNSGWEVEFKQGIRRVHLCSWACVQAFDVYKLGEPVKVHKLSPERAYLRDVQRVSDWSEVKPWMHRQSQVSAPALVQEAIDKALLKGVSDADEDTDLKRLVDDARLDKTVYTDEIDNV